MKDTPQEADKKTDKQKHDEAIDTLLGTTKHTSALEHIKPVPHITFEHSPHQCVTIMTHGILEIQTTLPPNQPHSIMLLHTTGTIQILGEALETLAMHLRIMQISHLSTGKQEGGGIVQKIVVNGGQG